jgi:hypothetical protein
VHADRRAWAAPVLPRGGADSLLLAGVAIVGVILLVGVRHAFRQDAWLALVAGRDIWHAGIPHHDTLAAMTTGRRWIDQQWLAQLFVFGLSRAGGLALVAVAHVALVMGSIGAALVLGRRLGTSARALGWLLGPCAFLVLLAPVRTQPYAYPLFVATVYLLARDSRSPSSRVYWTLALLVLWANLHGSALLGAALVALRGVTLLVARTPRERRRGGLLALSAPLCLLATPYGPATVRYYRETLFEHDFTRLVTEWRPVTSAAIAAVPFFILVAAVLWSLHRDRHRLTPWDLIALFVLLAGGAMALRNVVWAAFGLLILPVVPLPERPHRRRTRTGIPRALALAGSAGVVVAAVATLTRGDRYFEIGHPQAVLGAVVTQTRGDARLHVFADERFADWLLWRDPALRGRVAFDVRFELLSRAELDRIASTLKATGADWKSGARGYLLVVLSPADEPHAARSFRNEPGRRILFQDADGLVILRRFSEAA